MTAINDLVEKAGSPGIDTSLRALYDVALALQEAMALEVFTVEFRMPAEPVDIKEEPEPISVSQVDPYALAREMEGALRGLIVPERTPAVPAATAPQKADAPAAPAILNVNTVTRELRERLERLEKETISLPAVCSDLYAGGSPVAIVDRPLAGDHTFTGDRFAGGQPFTGAHAASQPPVPDDPMPAAERRIVEKPAERTTLEKSVKKSSIESTEQSVKRSASVVREFEDVYERLASSTIDVDKEIKRSTTVELDNARALTPPLENSAPLAEAAPPVARGRNVEVPAFQLKLRVPGPSEQAADNARQLSEAMARSSVPPMPNVEPNSVRAPEERPASAYIQAPAQVKTPVVPAHAVTPPSPAVVVAPPALVAVHNSLSVMNGYLASASGMAGAMDRMMAGGIITHDTQALRARAPLERTPPAEAQAPQSIASPVVVAPPALVAVHRSFNIINRYLASAAGMAGVTARDAGGSISAPGQALNSQGPLVKLMLDNAAPASSPVNMLVQAGGSVVVPVPQPMLVDGGRSNPAMSLAVNVAASRAAEHSDSQAMLNLARDAGYLPAGREPVIAGLPGAAAHVTDNNTTNKISNFHNTFNITVTVKGGGAEEGDLRDLGKKIGRILSDEIKRYGGI